MEPRTLGDGRYELIDEIGRGGMASVWRARDTRLNVTRAVKLLDRPTTARRTASARDRFDREARIMARLEHPHVVPVHDAGEDDGQLWIVMSFLEGGSVADRLKRDGALPLRDTIGIAAAVLEALAAAHAAGVVHRDVKPHNVLVDQRGVPRLTDFGIASAEGEGGPTRTGAILGTWTYMAPEQRVDAKRTDARTDVYAVGVLLVAMGLGRDPAELHDPERAEAALGAVPAPLRAFVRRCLRSDPAERFPSAEAALEALRAIPVPEVDPTEAVAAVPVRRRRRWGLAGAAVGVVVLLGLGASGVAALGAAGIVWSGWGRGEDAEDRLSQPASPHPADRGPEPALSEPEPAVLEPEPERAEPGSEPAGPAVAAPGPARDPAAVAPELAGGRVPPPAAPAPEPAAVPVRIAVAGGVARFEVHHGAEIVASGSTPWGGAVPAGEHQLLLLHDGAVVVRRAWDPSKSPQLCYQFERWEPCAR